MQPAVHITALLEAIPSCASACQAPAMEVAAVRWKLGNAQRGAPFEKADFLRKINEISEKLWILGLGGLWWLFFL